MNNASSSPKVGIVTGAGSGMGLECAPLVADLVDVLLLADINEGALNTAVTRLSEEGHRAAIEQFPVDITDPSALAGLAARVSETGTLRAVAHAAGISPTMADWGRIFTVDLVGSAMLAEALLPLATSGTALVCFASMAPFLNPAPVDPAIDAVLDEPLHAHFLDRIHAAVGPSIEDPGLAYTWAKRGVHRLVQSEAVRFGAQGARVCSVSPGIIDTPQGRQEAAARSTNALITSQTPLGREGLPEEVAAVTAFLLSSQASFVNGIDILVDGGALAAIRRNPSIFQRPS
jgi:NAD(P)-dependent dehydrogenase (short-subunit alcohol dehydrogenase family)